MYQAWNPCPSSKSSVTLSKKSKTSSGMTSLLGTRTVLVNQHRDSLGACTFSGDYLQMFTPGGCQTHRSVVPLDLSESTLVCSIYRRSFPILRYFPFRLSTVEPQLVTLMAKRLPYLPHPHRQHHAYLVYLNMSQLAKGTEVSGIKASF